ncbi:esterase-like activity of phytase family protein [Niveibacterium sp. 24ML]|uniref:esterase-like activity of phytase family protein n=1 Tax=Niveibacterium sp. 24ML TaxID=2985512 RepID=UPI00226EE9B1|nr:esterase-like activity of phytase family protein [Niveibacterium sp. 24ML]MCX9156326.1 esterase-like activity of phytase family protein [Niveibacterium sp. 24ML]
MKRVFLFAAILIASSANAAPLEYIGQQIVPSGTLFAGTTVGGLSSIDYDAATGSYFAVSDDRSAINPARFYTLSLDLSKFVRSATPGMQGVSFSAVTTLRQADGTPFPSNQVDPEGLRFDAARNTVFWSNEGARSGAIFQNPTVREASLSGDHIRDFTVSAKFLPSGSAAGLVPGDRGIYNNLAFESLAISHDGRTLWTATENALAQDGRPASVAAGSRARMVGFDIASGSALAEYIYDVSPVVQAPGKPTGFATNGLTDFVAIGDRQFITIERSFAEGAVTPGTPVTGNTIRLFYADARHATDVSAFDSIAGHSITPVSKSLLLDLSTLTNADGSALALDNIEGITLGPIREGKQTLVLVSDNNFSGGQFTQFVALVITTPMPEASGSAMLLLGLATLSGVARWRKQ